jgi:hypothetical protein
VDGRKKLVDPSDDMETVKVRSWMTWMSKGWGLVAGPVLDVEGMKVRSGGGGLMLKYCRTELVRGYLVPRLFYFPIFINLRAFSNHLKSLTTTYK